jgi:hypothetical protein
MSYEQLELNMLDVHLCKKCRNYLDDDGNCLECGDTFTINAWSKKGSAKSYQIGGDHYKKYPIEPMEYIIKNKLSFPEGNVVKYITRWRDKGGVQDLKKAIQNIQFIIDDHETNKQKKENP